MPPAPPARNPPETPARRVTVAGVGLISPLGHGAWPTFRALLAGRTIADRLAELEPDTALLPLVQAVGGVALARHAADDPAVELAERAAREAAADAGLPLAGLPAYLGTSKGSVVTLTRAAAAVTANRPPDPAAALAGALGPHGHLSARLAARTGVRVVNHAVAACASGLAALHAARHDLRQGRADAAVVISSEAALLPAFIASYDRLGVLAPHRPAQAFVPRSLDRSRRGFVPAEAGVAVVLRADDAAPPAAGRPRLAATACFTAPAGGRSGPRTDDPAHALIRSASNPAALRRVADALRAVTGPPAALHPHAPGTAEHDAAELAALLDAAGPPPAVYGGKGALGHSLGASGLVALVLAALCLRARRVPPMPWLSDPELPDTAPATGPDPNALHTGGPVAAGAHHVFAAGFGGHTAGAALDLPDA